MCARIVVCEINRTVEMRAAGSAGRAIGRKHRDRFDGKAVRDGGATGRLMVRGLQALPPSDLPHAHALPAQIFLSQKIGPSLSGLVLVQPYLQAPPGKPPSKLRRGLIQMDNSKFLTIMASLKIAL
jgi:hypothetical protein